MADPCIVGICTAISLGTISQYYLAKSWDKHIKVHKVSILDIKDKRQSSSVKIFQTLVWMLVDVRINYFTGIHMNNIIHSNARSYLNEMFKTNSQIHTHNTRNNTSLYLPKYNLVTGQRIFKFRCIKLWQNFTNNIKRPKAQIILRAYIKQSLHQIFMIVKNLLSPCHFFYQEYVTFQYVNVFIDVLKSF